MSYLAQDGFNAWLWLDLTILPQALWLNQEGLFQMVLSVIQSSNVIIVR